MRQRGTVRVRITVAAVVVVGVTLVAAGAAMLALLHQTLVNDVREAAAIRGEGIAEVVEAERDDAPLNGHPDEEFVQILDSAGAVIAASDNLRGDPPVAEIRGEGSVQLDAVPFAERSFLAVGVAGVDGHGRPLTIVVGRSLEPVSEALREVTVLLVFALPLLLVLVGFGAWWAVGRALAPVEAIRSEVEVISTQQLHRRVPDAPGSDEIARLARTMNTMLARLELEHARERQFVSDASHELRSPIASIRQHAEVAVTHPETTELDEFAAGVLDQISVLQGLVDDLMLLTRIDEGTLRLRREQLDLDDLVLREAARARATNPELRVDISHVGAGRTRGDATTLDRLIRNLSDNAARHARTTVAIGLTETDGRVVLTVEDDGEGIAPTERSRVFDRFVRLDEARDRDSGGSGLGLSIVREIATAHGGDVRVTDGELGGARFEVTLPADTDA
jgi:signal transduction histidine kinase